MDPLPAGLPDATRMAVLHASAMERPWTKKEFVSLLEQEGVFAYKTGEAFILCRVFSDESELLTLAVAPEAQRRGIARALLTVALAEAAARGALAMFLEVADGNAPAIALYAGAGFKTVGKRQEYYENSEEKRKDALVMRLDLA